MIPAGQEADALTPHHNPGAHLRSDREMAPAALLGPWFESRRAHHGGFQFLTGCLLPCGLCDACLRGRVRRKCEHPVRLDARRRIRSDPPALDGDLGEPPALPTPTPISSRALTDPPAGHERA
jgi:hypothetical protein